MTGILGDDDHRGLFAFFAFAAGVLSLLLFLFPLVYVPHAPGELLPIFERHRGVYMALAVLVLAWATVSVPCAVAMGRLVAGGGRGLSLAAVLCCSGGILLVAFAIFVFVGALLAIVAAAAAAPTPAAADYQAAVWNNLSFFLADPGLMVMGLGQVLLAWLSRKSAAFSTATNVVGFVGGAAGLLTLVTYQTSILAMVQVGAFGVWAVVAGAVVRRR